MSFIISLFLAIICGNIQVVIFRIVIYIRVNSVEGKYEILIIVN